MRADRDLRSAFQIPTGSAAIGTWPQAGLNSIAYRLAKLTVPRIGALLIVSALFYLV
jgi:hypothetical protein